MLACQRDSEIREFTTEVIDCIPNPEGGFWIELRDTILYPEGGGQPADHGWLDQEPVTDVQKQPDGRVLHQVAHARSPGPVHVRVDWERRFDHMQQHTGQHLLTAMVLKQFGMETLSFHLGEIESHIELDGPPADDSMRLELETAVNDEIHAARSVSAHTTTAEELNRRGVRTRGLPRGHQGAIRLIEIEGIDQNTCGGTHVQHTAQLGVLQLVRWERYKNTSRLVFLVGGRVRQALHRHYAHQQDLNRALQGGPEAHIDLIDKLSNREKQTARLLKKRTEELAELQAVALQTAQGPLIHHHQEDGDMGSLRSLVQKALQPDDPRVLLLTASDSSGNGVFLLAGQPSAVEAIGPVVAELVDGRGGGRGGRYQGKGQKVFLQEADLQRLEHLMTNHV